MADLANRLQELREKATPGPWKVTVGDDYHLSAAAYPAVKHPREVCQTWPDLASMGNGTEDFGRANADIICELVNNLDTIISALKASSGTDMGWQSIETAPKGEEVLLYEPEIPTGRLKLGARVVVARYPTSYPRPATHWMPLPKPPASTASSMKEEGNE